MFIHSNFTVIWYNNTDMHMNTSTWRHIKKIIPHSSYQHGFGLNKYKHFELHIITSGISSCFGNTFNIQVAVALHLYYMPVIMGIGLVGNTLSFLVMLQVGRLHLYQLWCMCVYHWNGVWCLVSDSQRIQYNCSMW